MGFCPEWLQRCINPLSKLLGLGEKDKRGLYWLSESQKESVVSCPYRNSIGFFDVKVKPSRPQIVYRYFCISVIEGMRLVIEQEEEMISRGDYGSDVQEWYNEVKPKEESS